MLISFVLQAFLLLKLCFVYLEFRLTAMAKKELFFDDNGKKADFCHFSLSLPSSTINYVFVRSPTTTKTASLNRKVILFFPGDAGHLLLFQIMDTLGALKIFQRSSSLVPALLVSPNSKVFALAPLIGLASQAQPKQAEGSTQKESSGLANSTCCFDLCLPEQKFGFSLGQGFP